MTCFIKWFIVNTLLKKPSQQRPSLMSLYFSEVLQKHSKGKLDVSRQWLFGPSDSYDFGDLDHGDPSPYVTPCAKNLGVLFDSGLKFDKQINAVVNSCFYHLRRLAKVKPVLSLKNFEIVIHAFITSRLDYYNSLYYGANQSSISRHQIVQNAVARLLTGSRKFDRISPILTSLHWLPVKLRIEFKILDFVFKALHGLAPTYLSDILQHHNPSRSLRSGSLGLLSVCRSVLKTSWSPSFCDSRPQTLE